MVFLTARPPDRVAAMIRACQIGAPPEADQAVSIVSGSSQWYRNFQNKVNRNVTAYSYSETQRRPQVSRFWDSVGVF